MSQIPIEAASFGFTPEYLKKDGEESPDLFTIRYGTRRDKRKYQDMVIRARVTAHTSEQMRVVTLSEMREAFDSDEIDIDEVIAAAERYWSEIDAFSDAMVEWSKEREKLPDDTPEKDQPELPKFDYDEQKKPRSRMPSISSAGYRSVLPICAQTMCASIRRAAAWPPACSWLEPRWTSKLSARTASSPMIASTRLRTPCRRWMPRMKRMTGVLPIHCLRSAY